MHNKESTHYTQKFNPKVNIPTVLTIVLHYLFCIMYYRQTPQHHELLPAANIPMAENGKQSLLYFCESDTNRDRLCTFSRQRILKFRRFYSRKIMQPKLSFLPYHRLNSKGKKRRSYASDGNLTNPDLQSDDVSDEPGMFFSGDMDDYAITKDDLTSAAGLSS
jgi:hypothetical protein